MSIASIIEHRCVASLNVLGSSLELRFEITLRKVVSPLAVVPINSLNRSAVMPQARTPKSWSLNEP